MARFSPRGLAFGELALESFRLNNRLLDAGDRLSADLGMTSARWQVLGTLVRAGGSLTVAEIARRMGLKRQSVQRIADRLDADGIVAFVSNPRHRRASLVEPTAVGLDVLERLETRRSGWADDVATDLDADAIEAAASVLRKIRERLETEAAQSGTS
ncbi:MAG: MarR family winged helix-turn-helix transcriptional regulator [Gammaproteobacteria bacterium]